MSSEPRLDDAALWREVTEGVVPLEVPARPRPATRSRRKRCERHPHCECRLRVSELLGRRTA